MKTPTSGRDHLDDSYKALESKHSDRRLEKSMRSICFTGAIGHIVLLFLFALMDAVFLVMLNIGSVVLWIYAFFLSQKMQYEKSVYLISAEMYMHAILATYFVGPDLGFQYYLWPVMGLLLTLPSNKLKQSTFFCFIVVISFVVLTLTSREIAFTYQLASMIDYIYAMNVIFSAMPFVFTVLYLRSNNQSNEKELFSQANMDLLTGTYNRRFVNDLMEYSGSEQRRRSFDSYSLVLCDVDHFKHINDSFGHQVGDMLIKEVAGILKAKVRDSDIVSRWGGEEFLVILANADTETTERVVQKIRHGIKKDILIPELKDTDLSLSFGIASAHRHMSFEETIRQADIKLYQAKTTGSDRVLS
ncbi:GGDEF domain-containing protein [Glaciecola sp. SC05]|uniref:GGDEF domain-containing protein n=1 Tax=Glaciecola sp. SC05 TaxID=1987355 RepID=UPI003527F9B9